MYRVVRFFYRFCISIAGKLVFFLFSFSSEDGFIFQKQMTAELTFPLKYIFGFYLNLLLFQDEILLSLFFLNKELLFFSNYCIFFLQIENQYDDFIKFRFNFFSNIVNFEFKL